METSELRRLVVAGRECNDLDYKEDLDPTSRQHIAGLAKDVAAFANTKGGVIMIGVADDGFVLKGLSGARLEELTPEDLDNKVNEYLEPRGDFDVIQLKRGRKAFVAVVVQASSFAPCVMKRDGNFSDPADRRTRSAFPRGAIFVRHGAKSAPATHHDIERIIQRRLETERRAWLERVRRVSEAPAGSEVIVQAPGTGVRVTTDPRAPAVRAVLDTSKITVPEEELTTAVKLWNTDAQALLSEHQLYRFYGIRAQLQLDSQRAEFLLRSSLARWMPTCYWASEMQPKALKTALEDESAKGAYPADHEALRLVFLLAGSFAAHFLREVIESSRHEAAVSAARRFRNDLDRSRKDRVRLLVEAFGRTVPFTIRGTRRVLSVNELLDGKSGADALATQLASELQRARHSGNKAALKWLDLGLYGNLLKGMAP